MKTLLSITPSNFQSLFNLKDILADSVFYPASGIDGFPIEFLSKFSNSFVYVDYSVSRQVVERAMRTHFENVGYKMIGIKHIDLNELKLGKFSTDNIPLNDHERQRLNLSFIRARFDGQDFTPFALWSVYELDSKLSSKIKGKIDKFSLLHIGGEACATLNAIYKGNRINPLAIAILGPGEGYGDNWTLFRDPSFRFYKILEQNHKTYNQKMPEYLLTNMSAPDICFWPNYEYYNRCFVIEHGWCNLYRLSSQPMVNEQL